MFFKCKYLVLIIAVLINGFIFGQDAKYKYSIEHISGDSFYFVERVLIGDRDTSVKYTVMKDTNEIKEILRLLKREQKRAERDWKALRKNADNFQSRYDQLQQVVVEALNLSVNPIGGGNNNPIDPEPIIEPIGFWVVYPTKGTKIQYLKSLREVKKKGLILNPDGTTMEIKNGILK